MRKESETEDPYDLIRRLRVIIEQQKKEAEEFQLACQSLSSEKDSLILENTRLKRENEQLLRRMQRYQNTTSQKPQLAHSGRTLSPLSNPQLGSSALTLLGSPSTDLRKRVSKTRQFIPPDVHFGRKAGTNQPNSILTQNLHQSVQNKIGEYLIQDFLIVAPDVLELRKQRELNREENYLKINKFKQVNFNKYYSTAKLDYLEDIAKRCYPLGATATLQSFDNLQDFRTEMQYASEISLCEDIFVLNLKGDFNEPPLSQRVFLGGCNPFRGLFAVCLRIPDFIPIKEQKHYQRSEQQVWRLDKIYVVLTYYPFLHVHIALLTTVHRLLCSKWHLLHRDELLAKNLPRNIADTLKNEQLSRMLAYLMSLTPDYNLQCIFDKEYLGTLPNFGKPCEYAMARYTCGIFFSVFAYEQVLLLLSALFMQKTIILACRNEGAATLCALFLVSCIFPFTYNHHLILNCNAQMIENIVFGFPLPLVATLKKDSKDFTGILSSFIDNSLSHFRGFQGKPQSSPLILVDLDSNCIFYDYGLGQILEKVVVEPSKEFRQAYFQVNPSLSKSFTFPRKMPVQVLARGRNDYDKNAEERKRLLKDYQQKIDNNTSKWPILKPNEAHLNLMRLFADYIQSLAPQSADIPDLLRLPRQQRTLEAQKILLKKHPDKQPLMKTISGSQIFADYLDNLHQKYPHHHY